MQIVTGYTGTEHIKSMHDRSRIAGISGLGTYILNTGSKLAATLQSANTVRISNGDLVMQGTHATIEAGSYQDITIENGTQGQKRNDLIVARYEKRAQNPQTESVTLKVIKGTPTTGTPADPSYEEGNILAGDLVAETPLYRVPIDGITPGEPVPLYDVLMPMADLQSDLEELRDSVSQVKVFSGSRVITFSSERHSLFEVSEQRSLFGRALDAARDYVGVMNGDGSTIEFVPHAFIANGRVIIVLDRGVYEAVRINYVVVLGS